MDDPDLHTAIAAHDAAEALIVLGWPVRPAWGDMETWEIGDFLLTDADLIGLAVRHGIRPAAERMQ